MSTIAALAALPVRATSAELRRHIGQPLESCGACGSPLWNVTHQAELRCAACGSGSLNNLRGSHPEIRRHVALRVLVVVLADGRRVGEEVFTHTQEGRR